jgi:hypothetical protein
VAVREEHAAEAVGAIHDVEAERLAHADARQHRRQPVPDRELGLPEVVVVAEEAHAAPRVVEATLERERVLVGRQDLLGRALPQLLDVAEQQQAVALAEVVGQGGVVGRLAAAEVVGAVSRATVVVGEDDQARGGELERLGARPRVGAVQAAGDRVAHTSTTTGRTIGRRRRRS